MAVGLAPREIGDRLRLASAMTDLSPERRLEAKIDMSIRGVTSRLREASDLLRACQALRQFRAG